ncbi:MAG: PH domain-containing protein [Thermomicrobiales bacterium]|nr:PH domain-containing protein [Thermomicrobiales bacterium]
MPHFQERQYTRQPWILLLVGLIALLNWATFVQQILRGKPVGENPMSDWGVWVLALLLGLGLPALILWMHVETTVEPDRLIVAVVPFTRRVIQPADIARFRVRESKPIREFGGWGIRGLGGSRAYLMSGNTGVQIDLNDGRTLYIGSSRPGELESAIAAMMEQHR